MNVSGWFQATPGRAEVPVRETPCVRSDHHQTTGPFQDTTALLEQGHGIVGMLDDVVQDDAIKRHLREADVFEPTSVGFHAKPLTRGGDGFGIHILPMDLPPQCPQASEPTSVTTTDIQHLAGLGIAEVHHREALTLAVNRVDE